MSVDVDLKKLRQKAYLQYQEDGLLDIVIGLAIIGFGLSMLASGFIALTWLPILMYVPLKMLITVPRFGYVEFDSEIENRKKLTRTMLVGVLTLSMFSGLFFWQASNNISPEFDAFISKYILLVLGFFIAVMLVGAAYLLGIKRFYIYAFLTIAFIWAGIELGLNDYAFVIFLGAQVFLAPGLLLLGRFLRKYPKSDANV